MNNMRNIRRHQATQENAMNTDLNRGNRRKEKNMNRNISIVLFAGLLFAGALVGAAEKPPAQAFDLSVLPPPKATVPALPADGSGYYRLHLDRALGNATLTVFLEIERGKVVRAAVLAIQAARGAWYPADPAQLAYADGRLQGTLVVSCPLALDWTNRRWKDGQPISGYKPFSIEPVNTATVRLDVRCDASGGSGEYAIAWSGKVNPFRHMGQVDAKKGSVSLVREAPRPLPKVYECDLYLYAALLNSPLMERHNNLMTVWLRLTMEGGASAGASAFLAPLKHGSAGAEVSFVKRDVSLRNGKLAGRLEATLPGVEGSAFVLDLEGQAIGRRLLGTVTCTMGEHKLTTQWIGLLHDVSAWRLSLGLPSGTWDWQHDLAADPELAAQVARETTLPVMPGEPGKAGFWTWRALMRGNVSSIYPPCFDLRETEGAAKYRFAIVNWGGDAKINLQFESDKPWHSLAAAWDKLPPTKSGCKLVVTPLDAAAKEMPGAMRMGIIDKETVKPATSEFKEIVFFKRPAFAGPYATKPARTWTEAALAIARWHRQAPGCAERSGNDTESLHFNGDHSYGTALANKLWANLSARALSDDPAERLLAEEMLTLNREELEIHQRSRRYPGTIYNYQSSTPLMHWAGEAICDAWRQTGDPRWKEAGLSLGRALMSLQNEDGSFLNALSPEERKTWGSGPCGYFSWKKGYPAYYTAELLYLLGRLRRDLQTEEFVACEARAHQFAREYHIRERNWPLNVEHSMSTGYPITQHSMAALYFCRYLLECAPAQRQDLKLAEEIARWAEDRGVDWTRAPAGKRTDAITPRINSGDRYNCEPIAVNLLAAIVFEELGQATKSKLWSAKGEALAVAVLQATDPRTGLPNSGLTPCSSNTIPRQFNDGSFVFNDFCNGWAAQLLREYAALNEGKK
jgi:hypothetical protein